MKELVLGEDFYFNRAGLMVLKEKYLLEKGTCCGKGCTHCPYSYANVPEPEKSYLITLRNGKREEIK